MKARVKATGDIVEVNQCYILYDDGRRELIYGKELEEVQGAPDYWTRLEHQAGIAAMQAQIAPDCLDSPEGVACTAYAYAHALVEKLKSSDL